MIAPAHIMYTGIFRTEEKRYLKADKKIGTSTKYRSLTMTVEPSTSCQDLRYMSANQFVLTDSPYLPHC